jgi:DUF4097 and DUF4098 domain-containing protein YvlB
MNQTTFAIQSQTAKIKITALGNLRIEGGDRLDVQAGYDQPEDFKVTETGNGLSFDCQSSLELKVPRQATIVVELAGRDAEATELEGPLKIEHVRGDLELQSTGSASVDRVDGDVDIERVSGDLAINFTGGDVEIEKVSGSVALNKAGGDLEINEVQGSVAVHAVGGDITAKRTGEIALGLVGGDVEGEEIRGNLAARRVGGDVEVENVHGSLAIDTISGDLTLSGQRQFRCSIGGDAEINITELFSEEASLNAGGDVELSLPAGMQARLEIASGGGTISVNTPGENYEIHSLVQTLTFGNGTARMVIRAGGDVEVNSMDKPVNSPETSRDFAAGAKYQYASIDRDEIEARVLASTRQVAERIDEARQRLEKRGIYIPGLTSNPPVPAAEPTHDPVGEDERLIILRMLQDKKITIEEAERLLEALDAQDLTGGD